jgi:uncharacterized membrane protein
MQCQFKRETRQHSISLCNIIITLRREIVSAHVRIAGSINSTDKEICQCSLSVVRCRHSHEKYLFRTAFSNIQVYLVCFFFSILDVRIGFCACEMEAIVFKHEWKRGC